VSTQAPSETTIFSTDRLQELWPDPLASQWLQTYPQLFDADDLRLTRRQPTRHFNEWLAAIYLFHRDGACSLVEKYSFANHRRKRAVLATLLDDAQRQILVEIRDEFKIQLPDLLVFQPDRSRFWFAEVKGPGDVLRPVQKATHEKIRQRLGVDVE
jgi:hypothetical protein